jgi:hypothetical protein
MKNQFLSDAKASFLFWAENSLLNEASAYINYSSKLFYNKDLRFNGYESYSSPFKQWVYDKSVSGANVCSGVYFSNNFLNKQSGIKIDYDNGRVLIPSNYGTGLNLTGNYSFKEYNFYLSNETEEAILTTSKFYLNSRYDLNPTGAIEPYSFVTPAIFINALSNENSPYALGGQKQTKVSISMIVFSETMDGVDEVISFFVDKKNKWIPFVSKNLDPINPFGDVKTGMYPNGYNYKEMTLSAENLKDFLYIESVRGSKLSDSFKTNESNFVGIIDFQLTKERFT